MLSKRGSEVKISRGGTLNYAEDSLSRRLFYFSNITRVNKWALFLLFLLSCLGLFNLLTISTHYFVRQIVYFLLFMPFLILLTAFNPRYFIKFSYLAFSFSLALLAFVLIGGEVAMGAKRWVDLKIIKFQPSEVAKLLTVLVIARYYHFVKESEADKLKFAIFPLFMIFSQVVLILRQPDLGTSLTIILIGGFMLFFAGLKIRYFVIAGLMCITMLPIVWGKLHDYQKKRVMTFLNPEEDTLGTGYNILQAKIAIGSGGLIGKGPFGGTQGTLDFLPESHTDFIFTVYAEQFGFIGAIFLIFLYALLIFYGLWVATRSESHFIRLCAAGISSMFFIHIVINLAMTSGLIPVVGNPLPFLSYGGTFLLSSLLGFGILLNLDINKSLVIHSSKETYMEK